MASEFRAGDWDSYRMDYHVPHGSLEPAEREIAVVDAALAALRAAEVLTHTEYDHEKMLAMRRAVAERFDIPWTAISPRVQRLIYAINAIRQPAVMVAAGCFCGNTFISNAGAAVGPGACYAACDLVGIEIKPDEAARAQRNVQQLGADSVARIVAADAVPFVRDYKDPIDLLYLDADGTDERGKGVYLDILEAGYDRMEPGSLVLAHNSVNAASKLHHYLAFVRDPSHFQASVNVVLDPEGLEVTVR